MTVGHSPDTDQAWVSAILAIRLPLYPKLRIQLVTQFSNELVRSVMAGELNLALVTAPPDNSQITAATFAETHLYAALPQTHAAAQKELIALQDLARDEWILFARRVHPVIHDAILDASRREGITPKHAHDIITAQQAVHLVSEHVGVAILTKPTTVGFSAEGVVLRPLSDTSLCFETCLIMRTDHDSRLANEFARSFLRRFQPQILPPKQMELSLLRLSCQLENGNPGDAAELGQKKSIFPVGGAVGPGWAPSHDNASEFCDTEQPTLRPLIEPGKRHPARWRQN